MSQIEAELAFSISRVESAAVSYLAASDALLVLTSDSSEMLKARVLIPKGYSRWFNKKLDINASVAHQLALKNRPILQAGVIGIAQADVRYQNALLKTRPDIRLKASLGLQQNASVYGYDSLFSSLSNVFDPDSTSQNLSVEYLYPLGNKAVKARKSIAQAQRTDADLSLALAQQTVEAQVNDAINQWKTAKNVKLHSNAILGAAQRSYKSILRLSRNGSVTQNQLINAIRDLQTAKTEQVLALVSVKRAEAAVLSSQGIIDQSFARWVAKSDFEVWRLAQLSKHHDFKFFVQ
jgi:outer membrane protein TolC